VKIIRSLALLLAAITTLSTAALAQPKASDSLTVTMKALNGSGEDGTATVTQKGDNLEVVISLKGAPKDVAQPTHIHIGTCGKINASPEYGLKNTVNGANDSEVKGVKLADLMSGKYAINVHKSADEIGTYVSCGNIVAPATK